MWGSWINYVCTHFTQESTTSVHIPTKKAFERAATPAIAVAKLNHDLIKDSNQKLNKGVPIQSRKTMDPCLGLRSKS